MRTDVETPPPQHEHTFLANEKGTLEGSGLRGETGGRIAAGDGNECANAVSEPPPMARTSSRRVGRRFERRLAIRPS